ncbi:MAG: hypothetical protein WAX14_13020, partial [Rhodococcus sp. (in: high G+C Gram-positive bacteria)]
MRNSGIVTGAVPALDTAGRNHLVFCVGDCADARVVVAQWTAQALGAGRVVTVVPGASAAEVTQFVRQARAGSR